MKLKNKVAVVTGGNSGIGLGIAQSFKEAGATGAIAGRNQETLDSALEQLGGDFVGIKTDVTKADELEELFKKTSAQFGKIDILAISAGGARTGVKIGTVAEIGEYDFDMNIELNLKSVYVTVHKALPYMNDGGSIILVGSSSAHRAFPGFSVYGAAKAAVTSFARGFSLDLLDRRIRVNVLTPGTIDTPIFEKFVPEGYIDQAKQAWRDRAPVKRLGKPSDIGPAAVYLASDESSYVVGTEIIIDGGMYSLSPDK